VVQSGDVNGTIDDAKKHQTWESVDHRSTQRPSGKTVRLWPVGCLSANAKAQPPGPRPGTVRTTKTILAAPVRCIGGLCGGWAAEFQQPYGGGDRQHDQQREES